MASARFAWGIDIGNRALKAIKLVREENGFRIDDFEVIEHETVLSSAGDNKEALIQSALANFVQRHATKGCAVAISVSGVSSFARFIKLPPVEPKKIPEIVRFEAIQQIPFPLDDVEWSYQLFQTPQSPDVEVGIFAMRRELINQHIKHFTDVDLNVQVVQMNPLAVYNAMYHDNRLQGTTMIVDLGAENTDLIIADGETIWLRSIPIGGNNFTEVLVKSFKLPFGKAEDLKRNANTSKYARQIFQAMRPVFADLVAEIQRSIGFYSSVHRDSRIKKVLALGGTFRLAGLQKYLQQNLQLDVVKLNEVAAGTPADAKLAATFSQNILSLVSAYGLAIQAMGEGKITSSLLPMKIRREKMWKDKTKWFGAAAAIFVAGTGLAMAGVYMRDLALTEGAATLNNVKQTVLEPAKADDQKWKTEVEGKGQDDRQTIQNVRAMLDGRGLWINLLGDIFGALPPVPAGYPSPDYLKTHPRNQREIILIDDMKSEYSPDLLKSLLTAPAELGLKTDTPAAGQASGLSPAAGQTMGIIKDDAIPPGSHGFIITLSLTTPKDQGYLYVLHTFIENLRKFNREAMDQFNAQTHQASRHYYIAKVSSPINHKQIKQDPARMAQMKLSYDLAQKLLGGNSANQPAPGTAPPSTPAAAADSDNKAYLDRLTKESRLEDWEGQVMFVVVIDPPAQSPVAQ